MTGFAAVQGYIDYGRMGGKVEFIQIETDEQLHCAQSEMDELASGRTLSIDETKRLVMLAAMIDYYRYSHK